MLASELWELTASGRFLPVVTTACAGQVECKRLVSTNAIDCSVTMQMGGLVYAITERSKKKPSKGFYDFGVLGFEEG